MRRIWWLNYPASLYYKTDGWAAGATRHGTDETARQVALKGVAAAIRRRQLYSIQVALAWLFHGRSLRSSQRDMGDVRVAWKNMLFLHYSLIQRHLLHVILRLINIFYFAICHRSSYSSLVPIMNAIMRLVVLHTHDGKTHGSFL